MTMYPPLSRSADIGKSVTPGPEPKPEPAKPAEGAPNYVGHARTGSDLRPSGHGLLAPQFARFSNELSAGLEADAEIRRRTVNAAFSLTEEEKLAAHREALTQAVRDGAMSEAEAHATWSRNHPTVDPATLKEKS